jgi:hypothetical protein
MLVEALYVDDNYSYELDPIADVVLQPRIAYHAPLRAGVGHCRRGWLPQAHLQLMAR